MELITAAPRDIPAYFHSTGSLEAKRQIKLISKARGQVDRLTVEEGDMVKKGHVILELDHREEALMVEQAKVKAGTAERELVRIRGLVDKGLASDKDYEANKELSESGNPGAPSGPGASRQQSGAGAVLRPDNHAPYRVGTDHQRRRTHC